MADAWIMKGLDRDDPRRIRSPRELTEAVKALGKTHTSRQSR